MGVGEGNYGIRGVKGKISVDKAGAGLDLKRKTGVLKYLERGGGIGIYTVSDKAFKIFSPEVSAFGAVKDRHIV